VDVKVVLGERRVSSTHVTEGGERKRDPAGEPSQEGTQPSSRRCKDKEGQTFFLGTTQSYQIIGGGGQLEVHTCRKKKCYTV